MDSAKDRNRVEGDLNGTGKHKLERKCELSFVLEGRLEIDKEFCRDPFAPFPCRDIAAVEVLQVCVPELGDDSGAIGQRLAKLFSLDEEVILHELPEVFPVGGN